MSDAVKRYDAVIVGAGHNSLVCAAYLAKAGRRVLLVEAGDTPGGLAAGREFFPGFKASVAHSLCHFSSRVAADLQLTHFGLALDAHPLPLVGLSPGGDHVRLEHGQLSGCGAADSEDYADYLRLMRRCADALAPFWERRIPRVMHNSLRERLTFLNLGLRLRRLGRRDMHELLRMATLPARDLLDEYFDDERVKALLCWDSLVGGRLAPRSPNAAVFALWYRMAGERAGAHALPAGGMGGLVKALTDAALAYGAEIRCGAAVTGIHVAESAAGQRAAGVVLDGSEFVAANTIVSGVDPKQTFLDLVGVRHLDIGFTNRIRRIRSRGYVAKLHLALDSEPKFSGLERADGRLLTAACMDDIEFAFDDAKYGNCPPQPVLEILVPSLADETLAEAGRHVLSAHVMYAPFDLAGGWTDAAKAALQERAIDRIAEFAPDIRGQIIGSELLTPADLERDYRLTGGHWHHGEFAIDQMLNMRPTYGAAQYTTPLEGLYLCGAGSHPGGDLTGMPGRNAAAAILA